MVRLRTPVRLWQWLMPGRLKDGNALRYLAELLIVFAGVYAAFLLDDVRQDHRNTQKSHPIQLSLLRQMPLRCWS